jgi:hypothetical protein
MSKIFQDDCVSVSQYASMIGRSRRTVQRYITLGMPAVRGTRNCIHLPTVDQWWKQQAQAEISPSLSTPQVSSLAGVGANNGGSND